MATLRFKPNEGLEPIVIQTERLVADGGRHHHVQCGERSAEVELVQRQPETGWLLHHGRVVAFHAVKTDRGVEVWHDGRRICLETADRRARREQPGHAGPPSDELAAPMPGTILKINVKTGDAFEAHQALVVMESMKMEMTLSAPQTGKVVEIRCKVGELVAMGAVLAKLAPK